MEKVSKDVKEKGTLLFREGKIKKEIETDKRIHFKVQGETEEHSVIFDKTKGEIICDCKWSSLKKGLCSHIYCVKLFLGEYKE
jgi:uncharacterized Zn finger protein